MSCHFFSPPIYYYLDECFTLTEMRFFTPQSRTLQSFQFFVGKMSNASILNVLFYASSYGSAVSIVSVVVWNVCHDILPSFTTDNTKPNVWWTAFILRSFKFKCGWTVLCAYFFFKCFSFDQNLITFIGFFLEKYAIWRSFI